MKNFLITPTGTVVDLGQAKTVRPLLSVFGEKPVRLGEPQAVPPAQPVNGVVVQQAEPPTPDQIAAVVRKLSVPKSLPSWRVEAVLKIAGKFDAAMSFIEALPEPQRTVTKCAWERNEQVERHGALLTAALPALSITDDVADEMFLQAATLVPN